MKPHLAEPCAGASGRRKPRQDQVAALRAAELAEEVSAVVSGGARPACFLPRCFGFLFVKCKKQLFCVSQAHCEDKCIKDVQ